MSSCAVPRLPRLTGLTAALWSDRTAGRERLETYPRHSRSAGPRNGAPAGTAHKEAKPVKGLKDRVVIVAGGASGIGAASAKRLGEEGARVVVGDLNFPGAEATAKEIVAAGGTAVGFAFDLADEVSCGALIAEAVGRWGALHGLFNCGADLSTETLGRDSDVVSMPLEVVERTLRVNLIGYFLTARHAIPAILEAGGGSIVNMTSGVVLGQPKFGAYGMAKGGVIALSRHIAARWGKEGVRCNALDPGITLTDNQRTMVTDDHREHAMRAIRSPRFGEPREIAAMVAFLLSEEAPWINGQTYAVSSSDGAR